MGIRIGAILFSILLPLSVKATPGGEAYDLGRAVCYKRVVTSTQLIGTGVAAGVLFRMKSDKMEALSRRPEFALGVYECSKEKNEDSEDGLAAALKKVQVLTRGSALIANTAIFYFGPYILVKGIKRSPILCKNLLRVVDKVVKPVNRERIQRVLNSRPVQWGVPALGLGVVAGMIWRDILMAQDSEEQSQQLMDQILGEGSAGGEESSAAVSPISGFESRAEVYKSILQERVRLSQAAGQDDGEATVDHATRLYQLTDGQLNDIPALDKKISDMQTKKMEGSPYYELFRLVKAVLVERRNALVETLKTNGCRVKAGTDSGRLYMKLREAELRGRAQTTLEEADELYLLQTISIADKKGGEAAARYLSHPGVSCDFRWD